MMPQAWREYQAQLNRRSRIQQPSHGFDWRWVVVGAGVFAVVGAVMAWVR